MFSVGDNLHKILKPIFWESKTKYFKMSAEIFSQPAEPNMAMLPLKTTCLGLKLSIAENFNSESISNM